MEVSMRYTVEDFKRDIDHIDDPEVVVYYAMDLFTDYARHHTKCPSDIQNACEVRMRLLTVLKELR